MTKTFCDICGREIAPNYLRSNRYWMKIEPYTSIVGDSKQVNEEWEEICFECASEISSYVYSMSNRIR